MSVAVEALTLIVPHSALDGSYPGGTNAYLADVAAGEWNARWVCGDAHLTAASYYSDDIERGVAGLVERGFTLEYDGTAADFVVLDEITGPLVDCEWIEWTRQSGDGHSIAWFRGVEHGELLTPANWAPSHLVRIDVRDEPGMLQLADEDGAETWLDTRTGRLHSERARAGDKTFGPLMRDVHDALDARGWDYAATSPRVAKGMLSAGALRHEFEVRADEIGRFVHCSVTFPLFVPHCERGRHTGTSSMLARLNEPFDCAAYTLDARSGGIRVRLAVEVIDERLGVVGAGNILAELERLCEAPQHLLLTEAARWLSSPGQRGELLPKEPRGAPVPEHRDTYNNYLRKE